jgi:hypothetical protein
MEYDLFNQQALPKRELVHQHENTVDSQEHLNENKDHFSNQCKIVYAYLMTGKGLSQREGMLELNIQDSHRRSRELEEYGVHLSRVWVKGEEKNKYKIYVMSQEQRDYNLKTFGETLCH